MTNTTSPDLVKSARKINKAGRIVLLVVSAALMLLAPAFTPTSTPGASGPLAMVQPQTAAADGLGHFAVIKLSKQSDLGSMRVCRSYPSCDDVRVLNRGENTKSKFGWSDADAFYLPAGWDANVTPGIGRKTKTGVQKLYGCGGCTRTVDFFR